MATRDLLRTAPYEKLIGLCIFPKNTEEINFSGSLNLKGLLSDEFLAECCCENSEGVTKQTSP